MAALSYRQDEDGGAPKPTAGSSAMDLSPEFLSFGFWISLSVLTYLWSSVKRML